MPLEEHRDIRLLDKKMNKILSSQNIANSEGFSAIATRSVKRVHLFKVTS